MDKETIEARLQEHLSEAMVNENISDWFVIASNGSMNYGLDNEDSDIDSKLLTVPSLKKLIENKRDNTTHIMSDNGEHVEVKDVVIYMNTILKQNINFVETLFAKAVIVNPRYQNDWEMLYENRELIARYDTKRAVKCMYGMMVQKRKDMETWTEARAKSFHEFGYDTKSLHHLVRLHYFLQHYIVDGWSYEDCLTKRDDAEYKILMDTKSGNILQASFIKAKSSVGGIRASALADEYLLESQRVADKYIDETDVSDIELSNRWDIKGLIDLVVYGIIENNVARSVCFM